MSEEDVFICSKCGNNKIISVHTELGKIIFECKHIHDVVEYLKYLRKEKGIELGIEDNKNDNLIEEPSEKLLSEKIQTISDIIRTNQLVLKTQEKYPENYYHVKSIINIGRSIEKEEKKAIYYDDINNVKDKDIDKVIKAQIRDKKKEEDDAIKKLKDQYNITINNEIEEIKLKGEKKPKKSIWLKNKGFKLISQIRFKNLIELNLARNGITQAKYLDNMLLPYLEHLDLSYNQIDDVKPVANLKSKNLRLIFLQNNKIEKLSPFKFFDDKQIGVLETLRVDKNTDLDVISEDFKTIKRKFGKKLLYKNVDLTAFNKKYNEDLSDNDNKLDFCSIKHKYNINEILLDLSYIITYQFKIQYLILDDNKLENVSILSRMPLSHLIYLDLSLNLITNIKFLKKLSKISKKLQTLYLNDNKILDITPLKEYSGNSKNYGNSEEKGSLIFKKLVAITLKHNPFYSNWTKKDNTDDILKDNENNRKGNIEDRPNENATKEEVKEENSNYISIKDKETRSIFKSIIEDETIVADFGKNTKVKEEEEEEEKNKKKEKEEEEAKQIKVIDDDIISNTNNDDIKTENNNSEN